MNLTRYDILNKVVTLLGAEKPKEEEVELAEATTEDGVTLVAESFEPGKPIFIVNEGEQVPAEPGKYNLPGVGLVVVEEMGVIATVEPAGEQMKEEEKELSQDDKEDTEAKKDEEKEDVVKEEEKTELTRDDVAQMIKDSTAEILEEVKKLLPGEKVEMQKQDDKKDAQGDEFIKKNPEGDKKAQGEPLKQLFTLRQQTSQDRVIAKLWGDN